MFQFSKRMNGTKNGLMGQSMILCDVIYETGVDYLFVQKKLFCPWELLYEL